MKKEDMPGFGHCRACLHLGGNSERCCWCVKSGYSQWEPNIVNRLEPLGKDCKTCGFGVENEMCKTCQDPEGNLTNWKPIEKGFKVGAGGGAPKNDAQEDKPMMHLIPMDLLAHFLEPAYREGLIKYYWESWRKGFSISRMISGLRRHEEAFYHRGEDLDPDAVALGINKHHLGGMLFCVLCMCDTVMNHPEMDDRPIKRMYEPLP